MGRKGEPAMGAESILRGVVGRLERGVLFVVSGTGISTLSATLRVVILEGRQ